MIKKMIYLDEGTDVSLRRIAHSRHTSVSQIIRDSIRSLFKKEEVYDLAEYDRRMAEYLGDPSSAVPFRDIMDK
jgi:hypothetical protein